MAGGIIGINNRRDAISLLLFLLVLSISMLYKIIDVTICATNQNLLAAVQLVFCMFSWALDASL